MVFEWHIVITSAGDMYPFQNQTRNGEKLVEPVFCIVDTGSCYHFHHVLGLICHINWTSRVTLKTQQNPALALRTYAEVEFVHPVSHSGSVKFVASGVNFSIFTNFLCFFLLKLLKLGEIDGVKFLTWKSGGVKFWTNFMSEWLPVKGGGCTPRFR